MRMGFCYFNPNPDNRFVGDCTIRAICKLTDQDWDTVYAGISLEGFLVKNMPSGNEVWGSYLYRLGYVRMPLPDMFPRRYTVLDFCRDHPNGKFLLALDQHVVTVVDGDYYDTWDSGREIPFYYWVKGNES